MRKILASLGLVVISFGGQAALPPYYQSVKEIQAIASDATVAEKLSGDGSIKSIVKSKKSYIVKTDSCTLDVTIKVKKSEAVGPAQFEVKTGEVSCQ